jgi:pyrimidine operon attenuation protein / uracil phosphoribosyltransferase
VPKPILDADAIERAISSMADALVGRKNDAPWAVVGIRRGGEALAHRLAACIERLTGQAPPVGTVDITLYRDDGFGPHDWPVVGTSRIGFDLPKHTVILVDDVLYTGRTVRAAVDAILDYGRPKAVRLAVLVDRGLRELPIAADATGQTIETRPDEHVTVRLGSASSAEDVALIEPRATGHEAQTQVPPSAGGKRDAGRGGRS